MMEIAQAQGLTLRYPYTAKPILQDISFTLGRGERVLLLGPSGSGKSSLSLCLNGLIPHSVEAELRGSLCVFDRPTLGIAPAELARRVGIVFQDPESQFCTLTVEDEVAFGLENLGLSRIEIDTRINQALAQVGLSDQRRTRLDRLSGGMKQRLALAAALAMAPELLVLDEVTANLDPAGAAEVFEQIEQLARQAPERTFLLIEHRLDRLIGLIDRVWVLDEEGRLIYDTTPRRLFAQYGQALEQAGIWQPTATRLAHHLQQAGLEPVVWPLTLQETLEMIHHQPESWPLVVGWARPGGASGPGSEAEVIVQLREVAFSYPDGSRAVERVNLEVRRGEVLALVGANGAGKTTLAQLMAGLLRPQQGSVQLLGEETSHLSARTLARRCGFVFQNPEHQFVTDQVFDEVAFGLRQQGLDEAEIRARVEAHLARLGLLARQKANPFELSQGQKRRLSVATMLVGKQELLILDEPTFGQDACNARELTAELRRLNQEGLSLVLVTHDMELVWELAQRVAVMAGGRLLKVGPVTEIFADTELLWQSHLTPPPQAILAAALQEIATSV
jgi:energy-coupling factor transport system ATP-binding protein